MGVVFCCKTNIQTNLQIFIQYLFLVFFELVFVPCVLCICSMCSLYWYLFLVFFVFVPCVLCVDICSLYSLYLFIVFFVLVFVPCVLCICSLCSLCWYLFLVFFVSVHCVLCVVFVPCGKFIEHQPFSYSLLSVTGSCCLAPNNIQGIYHPLFYQVKKTKRRKIIVSSNLPFALFLQ